jgi:hypothetical protein
MGIHVIELEVGLLRGAIEVSGLAAVMCVREKRRRQRGRQRAALKRKKPAACARAGPSFLSSTFNVQFGSTLAA